MEGIKYMRGRKLIAVALAASLWLGGYASYAYGWEPVIDLRMDSAIATQDRDLAECRELASRASGDTMTEVAKTQAIIATKVMKARPTTSQMVHAGFSMGDGGGTTGRTV